MWGRIDPRYRQVAILAAVIILANVIARLFGIKAFDLSDDHIVTVGLVFFGVITAIAAVATFWWSVRYPLSRVIPDIGLALIISCAVIIFITPYIGNLRFVWHHWSKIYTVPFHGGAGVFFGEIWKFAGFTLGGAVLGLLAAMAIGKDYRAQQLKQFTQTVAARPRRAVRR